MRLWWRQLWVLLVARNREFVRDRATLIWNIAFPSFILAALLLLLGQSTPRYTVTIESSFDHIGGGIYQFLNNRYIRYQHTENLAQDIDKVRRHQLDMLLDLDQKRYWVNRLSANGYLLEKLLHERLGRDSGFERQLLEGEPIRYVEWVLPGIIGLNILFGSLWGVGFVVVRYRQNGVLKRIFATPVSALQYLLAQLLSRLLLLLPLALVLILASVYLLEFRFQGSLSLLMLVYTLGAFALVSIGSLLASRLRSQELASGMISCISWPMMLLAEIWFSLEAAPSVLRHIASYLPLSQMVFAAREIMLEGAGFWQVSDSLVGLLITGIVFLTLSARLFRWH